MDPNCYPVNDNLFKGGGTGHVLQELYRTYPNLPGKPVLQDLKGVVEEAEAPGLDKKSVTMEHDFFTAQPIIGARAYYMRTVLHDWPDSKAHEILLNIKPGLKKGYSKLLVNETVIPDRGVHWLSTALDMVMMVNFSATERTEQDWRTLLGSAGVKIVKIWTYKLGTESLIEAESA